MCRLAAFPPGCGPELAHEVIADCVGNNDDGVGSVYIDPKEGFVLKKYAVGYKEALTSKKPIFDHMPCKSWTVAHVRAATHGDVSFKNTHPIIRGNTAVAHNGIFMKHALVKAALSDSVKWQGETDSEVGAYILNKIGAQKFYETMVMGDGVWLGLQRDGGLMVAKLSGDLEINHMTNDTFLLASDIPTVYAARVVQQGWYLFDKEGHPSNFSVKEKSYEKWNNKHGYGYGGRTNCGLGDGWEGNIHSGYTRKDVGSMEQKKIEFRQAQENTGKSAKELLEIWGDYGWSDNELEEYVKGLA